jgi:hypothetical protein
MKKLILFFSCILFVQSIIGQVNVTFNVDMTNEIVNPTGVHIAGNFQDPDSDGILENPNLVSWSPWDYELTDADMNGVYSITLQLVSAVYEFKFINGNDWQDDFGTVWHESIPNTCAVGGGNTNRQIVIAGSDTSYSVCYNNCAACGENAVRFAVDMNFVDEDGDGIPGEFGEDINPIGVFVAGDFQGWDASATPLYDFDSNGIWEGYYSIGTATTIEYKFINGNDWNYPSENVAGACSNGGGNRTMTIESENTVLPFVCWNSCSTCVQPTLVTFNVGMTNEIVSVNGVHLIGSFNWSPGDPDYEMTDPDGDGIYSVTIELVPGDYDYAFVNGTEYSLLESVPSACNFGGWRNLIVGGNPISVEFCFNSCDAFCDPYNMESFNYFENFDSFLPDDFLSQTENWVGWNQFSGNSVIVDSWSNSGANSLLIDCGTDLIYPIGPFNNGQVYFSFDMFIPEGSSGAYFNLLHNYNLNTGQAIWASEFFFDELGNFYPVTAGQEGSVSSYGIGGWISVEIMIDLDTDIASIYLNNELAYTWNWLLSSTGQEIPTISALNFYDVFLNGVCSTFVVDNFYATSEVPYCEDVNSCNYGDLGSCIYIGNSCNDGNYQTTLDSINSNCVCEGLIYSYGSINDSNAIDYGDVVYLCNGESTNLIFQDLPENLGNYTLQWYYYPDYAVAPPASGEVVAAGYQLLIGATEANYSPPVFDGYSLTSYACLVTPDPSTGLPAFWAQGNMIVRTGAATEQQIIGNSNIVPLNTYSYVVPANGYVYIWSAQNGFIVSGQGTNAVQIMWLENGPYVVSLTVQDYGNVDSDLIGCSATSSFVAANNSCNINVSANSPTSSICPGASVLLSATTGAPNVSYQWYLDGLAIANATSSEYTASMAGSYQVSIAIPGCSALSNTLELVDVIIDEPIVSFEINNTGCGTSSATLSFVGSGFNSFQWSSGSTTNPTTVVASGDYFLGAIHSSGCVVYSDTINVNLALQQAVPICLVSVDEVSGNNIIVWEPMTSESIASYTIYKETNVADAYAEIGSVPYGSDGLYADVNSNAAVQSSRYKIGIMDICDVESSLSDLHKTIHLTSNLGVGNTVNLIWSHYEGFAFGSYNIYRGTASDNMTLLATIASNLNSYTDLLPLTNGYYMIEVEGVSCDPSRTIQTSKSNVINYELLGVDDLMASQISIYPNPATNNMTLNVSSELVGGTYKIYDALGREVMNGKLSSASSMIDVDSLARGSYRIAFVNAKAVASKALILE